MEQWLGASNTSLCWKSEGKQNHRYKRLVKISKPHSFWPVPAKFSDQVQQCLRDGALPEMCRPEATILARSCECSAGWEEEDEPFGTALIYTARGVVQRKVFVRWCKKRVCRAHFDGSASGIFNYSSKTMATYDVLRDYAHCALSSGMTFSGFCAKKTREYQTVYGVGEAFLGRKVFTKMFTAYAERKERSSLPPCDICQQYPPVLLADATDLGMPLKHLEATYREILPENAEPNENVVVPFVKRILITSPKTREKLLCFVEGSDPLDRQNWNRLLADLRRHHPSLASVLEHLYMKQPNRDQLSQFHFAGEWTNVLKVLGSFNSITDLVRPSAYDIVHRLAEEDEYFPSPEDREMLQQFAPLILEVLLDCGGMWPVYARPLLGDILSVCQKPFIDSVAPVLPLLPTEQGDPLATGHWYVVECFEVVVSYGL